MNQEITLAVDSKIILVNVAGLAVFILFFILLESISGSTEASSLAVWIVTTIVSGLTLALIWQLGFNRATLEGNQLTLRAGFYQQRWPAKILEATWSAHSLKEFHRDNGIKMHGYTAGYYSRIAGKREYLLAIGSDEVRCLKIEGHPALCLDSLTHDRILALWQGASR